MDEARRGSAAFLTVAGALDHGSGCGDRAAAANVTGGSRGGHGARGVARDAGARVERMRNARLSRVATRADTLWAGMRVERWRRESRRLERRRRWRRRLDTRHTLRSLTRSIVRSPCIQAALHSLQDPAHNLVDASIFDILLELVGKRLEVFGRDVDLVAEVAKQLTLHLVDLAQAEEALANNGPALVRVRVVAAALAGNHERRDEKTVT